MFAVRAEIESQLRSTLYGVTASMFIVSLTPEHSKLTAADISSDYHEHCLHARMKVHGRLSSVVLNSILPCGQTSTLVKLSNSKFDKYRKCCFRSYREAVASYRYPIPEGVHRKSKLSS